MTQTFQLPGLNDSRVQAVAVKIPDALEALRSNFSGATAPAAPNSAKSMTIIRPTPCQEYRVYRLRSIQSLGVPWP